MTTLKTFRRDKLRRMIEAGRVVTVSTYHFDDMTGEHRGHKTLPVAMTESGADWRTRKEGVCYLFPSDLTTKSGACYTHDDPTLVTLIVHSNSSFEFRILPETK